MLQFLTPEQLVRANAGLNNSTSPSKPKIGTKIAAAPITDQTVRTKSDSRKWACHFCHKPPFHNKNSLHYHLAGVHFKDQIKAILGDTDTCPECSKKFLKMDSLIGHVGTVHRYLDKFLPDFLLDTPQDYNEDDNKEAALTRPVTTFKKKAVESDKSDEEEESDNDWNPSGDMVKKIKLDHKKKYLSYKNFVKTETSSSASAAQNVLTCHICFMSNGRVFASRSKLYEHYSEVHYRDEIEFKFGTKNSKGCPDCGQKKNNLVYHLGVTHNHVEEFLPKRFHIPLSTTKKDLISPSPEPSCPRQLSPSPTTQLCSSEPQAENGIKDPSTVEAGIIVG